MDPDSENSMGSDKRKLYRFNSWFEWELDSLFRTGSLPILTRPKQQRNRFLERLFLALSHPEDAVVLSSPIPSGLAEEWKKKGWEVSNTILEEPESSGSARKNRSDSSPLLDRLVDFELVEFGGVRSFEGGRFLPDESIWRPNAFWNSRIEQARFSQDMGEPWVDSFSDEKKSIGNSILEKWEWVEERSRIFHSAEDLRDFMESFSYEESFSAEDAFLFKSNYSSSGRGHVLWRSPKDNHRLAKVEYPVLCEPFHPNRSVDFGILLDGKMDRILGVSRMWIGSDFQFKGCIFYAEGNPSEDSCGNPSGNSDPVSKMIQDLHSGLLSQPEIWKIWQKFIYTNSEGAPEIHSGPAAWDGYFLEDGRIRIRSEINYRWSMGRIAREVRKKRNRSEPEDYGIFILHKKERLPFPVDFELTLTESTTEPWRILYFERRRENG